MIELQKGDITKLEVATIVNAANTSLLGGGGVDGAIHRAGGKTILEDCMKIRAKQGGCATGEAVITTGGNLLVEKVIHTVGPVWYENNGEKNDQLLANCYQNSLKLARENNLRSVAFPNISTGVYRFPKYRAAAIAIATTKSFLQQYPNDFDTIVFICFDEENYSIYQELLE